MTHSWVFDVHPQLERITKIGWVGVDLFFVLSGFLITRILLNTKTSPDFFRSFYLRRALRVWPVYYGILFFIFVVARHFGPPLDWSAFNFSHQAYPWFYYVLYLQNILGDNLGPFPLGITWSLAVEEHYYLAWPLIVRFAKREWLLRILVAVIILTPLFRFLAWHNFGASNLFIFRFTLCRLDGLAWGGLLAYLEQFGTYETQWIKRWSAPAYAILLIAVYALASRAIPSNALQTGRLIWTYSLLAACFAGLIGLILLNSGEDLAFASLLRSAPMRYVGKISYAVYLFHASVFVAVWNSSFNESLLRHGLLGTLLSAVIAYSFVFAAASFSWYLLESPILRLKNRLTRQSLSESTFFKVAAANRGS
jgi:peptidoglycan/LPS O-acetylase OafA/YrhL